MAEQIRVLVTHDDPTVGAEIVCLLTQVGCEARVAHNGLAALAVLADGWRPDAILMKPGMSGLDGAAFRAEMRLRGSLAAIPLGALIEDSADRARLDLMAPDEVIDCSAGLSEVVPEVLSLVNRLSRAA